MAKMKLIQGIEVDVPYHQLERWLKKTLADLDNKITHHEQALKRTKEQTQKRIKKIKMKLRKYMHYRVYLMKELGMIEEKKKTKKEKVEEPVAKENLQEKPEPQPEIKQQI